jgi:hypothetical protein
MRSEGSFLKPAAPLSWQTLLLSVSLACALFLADTLCFAQQNQPLRTGHSRERTRELIDGYSNSVGSDGDFERPRQPENRLPAGAGSFDLKELRPLVRKFSEAATQLTYSLNDQMAQLPGLRKIYSEALRLSGTAVNVNKHAEKHGADRLLQEELQQLDADWRELAYRVENVRGLSEDSRTLVADANEIDNRIRQLIGIQPQLDRLQLNLKVAGLAADLENLQEDISSELGNGQNAQAYRRSVSRVRQVVLNLMTVIRDDRSGADVIVDEYKQFETLWTPLIARLRTEDDRTIERSLRRVSASASQIHQLLLLPQKMDKTQFVFLATALKKDIDEFFERTPLILVMQLPKSKQALATADQFYSVCARFVEVVNRGPDESEILDSFRKIEQAERAFNDVYGEVDSDRAVAVLNRISQTVNSLRSSLQIQGDDFDSQTASEIAASIQNFTEQLESTTKHWLEQDRQPFVRDCLREVADLSERAAHLHDDLLDGRSQTELKTEMTDLYETWRRVYGYLINCNTQDRPTLGRLSSSLTPAMVELRTMILQ